MYNYEGFPPVAWRYLPQSASPHVGAQPQIGPIRARSDCRSPPRSQPSTSTGKHLATVKVREYNPLIFDNTESSVGILWAVLA